MNTNLVITEQLSLIGLRQQAQRLGIKGFSTMRKHQLITHISHALKVKMEH